MLKSTFLGGALTLIILFEYNGLYYLPFLPADVSWIPAVSLYVTIISASLSPTKKNEGGKSTGKSKENGNEWSPIGTIPF